MASEYGRNRLWGCLDQNAMLFELIPTSTMITNGLGCEVIMDCATSCFGDAIASFVLMNLENLPSSTYEPSTNKIFGFGSSRNRFMFKNSKSEHEFNPN